VKPNDGTRTRAGKTPSRPTSSGGPPRLQTNLWGGLKALLLINIVPLFALGYIAVMWALGKVTFDARMTPRTLLVIGVVLASCALFAFSAWVLAPVGRWLRDYPAWHARNTGPVWLLPAALGWLAWVLIWFTCLASAVVCLLVTVKGLWLLWEAYRAGQGA